MGLFSDNYGFSSGNTVDFFNWHSNGVYDLKVCTTSPLGLSPVCLNPNLVLCSRRLHMPIATPYCKLKQVDAGTFVEVSCSRPLIILSKSYLMFLFLFLQNLGNPNQQDFALQRSFNPCPG